MKITPANPFCVSAFAACLLAGTAEGAEPSIDFAREVRPILSEHCFPCHGPNDESRKAGLSLVDFDSATAELESGFTAVVPGSRDRSEMWLRITDPEDPMPPAKEHKELSPEQVEILGQWISGGADYAPHWAYVSPRPTAIPAVDGENWPTSDIDQFILERLQREGLQPAADADQITLFRRLNYDLTGLPPSLTALDAFLADDDENAYAGAVDELLASPHFGERLASAWLDLVRYADTVGYHGDQEHRVWPYRDWVIAAFNSNMPFDRFTIEQLAGDLLENPDQQQLVATCYNRLIQTSHEGGLQLKEYRSIYMADRVRNVSEVWMGATLGCAQCHDHKYDPYRIRDFYSFGSFFADIDDEEHIRDPYGGLNTTPTRRSPEMRVMTDEGRANKQQLASNLVEVEQLIESAIEELEPRQPQWEQDLNQRVASGERHPSIWVDDVLDTGGTVSGRWDFVREDEIPPHSGELYRRQTSNGQIQHYTVDTTHKRITVGEGDTLFAWVYLLPDSLPKAVMLQCNTAGDWEHRAVWGGDEIGYGRREKSDRAYQRMGELPPSGQWTRIEVPFEKIGLKAGTVVSGIAFTQFGGTVYWDDCGHENASAAPAAVIEVLAIPSADRTDQQRQTMRSFQADQSPEVSTLRAQRAGLQEQDAAIEKALPLTLFTRALKMPREIRILPRGNWLDESGEIVEPAIPAFLGTLKTAGRGSRLDLARWLVTAEADGGVAGMTARVFVNRMWALLFGEGLCPSVEDFGGQGRPPTHPELLDHLANEFIASGWDIHALFRKMVLSRTYRQSSNPDPLALEQDPENLLFSHQARYRLPAEMVRDMALSLSGLLVDRLGGPSVKPPQPAHYYRHLNFPPRRYKPDMNQEQWRRGVYVHWQRQFLHPMLLAFDAPVREDCTARRARSNTPLASLVLMNDPVFVEAARGFAQRILFLGLSNDEEAIAFAMREATCRQPNPKEVAVLTSFLVASREYFAANPDVAKSLLAVGSSPVPETSKPNELAAWAEVTRAILNLHETITRE
ncbi:MAG: PSD1 and planctomycete cytochrome C domain-containing protein [Planctomycetota bacterium]|nr:PSD1 and planctomycete cytochrome C domain-containing protein [Planctomycetota bacterium]